MHIYQIEKQRKVHATPLLAELASRDPRIVYPNTFVLRNRTAATRTDAISHCRP